MKVKTLGCLIAMLAWAAPAAMAGGERNWQSGKLLETEQEKVLSSKTKTSNTEGTAKNKGNKTDYSESTTSTTTEDYDTYQIYTIEGEKKIYVARERLLWPWSKPANVTVGESFKYAVEGNKLYLRDDDGKEHKATVVKVSLKTEK